MFIPGDETMNATRRRTGTAVARASTSGHYMLRVITRLRRAAQQGNANCLYEYRW